MFSSPRTAGAHRWACRAVLVLLALVAGVLPVLTGPARPASASVVTNGRDALRTGWDPSETTLSPATVSGPDFGQLYSLPVTGQVYAQPLVSDGVLLVVTEHNDMYGFNVATGSLLWTRNVGPSFDAPVDLLPFGGCADITPEVGITSTPVIDEATGTAYVMAKTKTSGVIAHHLHAIDLKTGAERAGFPVPIQGQADNDPSVSFNPRLELQRPGLLLMDGVVYAGFSGHCDRGVFAGWVVGVSTTTASLTGLWTDEAGPGAVQADGPGGGIWQAGSGLMSDASGDIVLSTGNGTPPPNGAGADVPGTLGQSMVRLRVQADGTLKAVDHFSPYDASVLNQSDSDVGSGGPVALPPQYFGTPAHPRLNVLVGKQGYIWLTDAGDLGGVGQGPLGSDKVVSRIGPIDGGVWGKPAVWPGNGGYVYLTTAQSGAGTGRMKAYRYSLDGNGNPTLAFAGQSADLFGFGSSSPMVTSDGTTPGSALVWTVWAPNASGVGAQLRAYDPVPVNGTMVLRYSAPIGTSSKFLVPSSDGGKVFVGTRDGHVLAFGSPVQAPLRGSVASFPRTTVGSTSTATMTVTADAALTVGSVTSNNPAITVTSVTPAPPSDLVAGGSLTVGLRFAPTSPGPAAAAISFATSLGAAAVSASGTGQSAGPSLSQFPCCLSFGGVVSGSGQKSETVTFGNAGAAPLVINGYTLPAAPYTVSGLPPVGSSIASGATFTATVTFAPQDDGLFTDVFEIATNDPAATGDDLAPGSVSLAGTGGSQPAMRITPTALDYGDVPVGTTATHSFTVTNTGGTDLTITISKPPDAGQGFSARTELAESTLVPAGQSVTERVDFTPTGLGQRSDVWAITGNDGGGRQEVPFTGRGVAAAVPSVSISDLDVQRPTDGSTVATIPVTLSAPSSSPVTVTFASKDGTATAASGDYVATSGTLTIPAGQTAASVPITVNGSPPTPTAETVTVTLGKATGAVLADASAKLYLAGAFLPVSIYADDVAATATGPTGDATLAFSVAARPAPAPGQPVTVNVATADGTATTAAGDYAPVARTVTLTSAAPTAVVPVPVTHVPGSGGKTVQLLLSSASSGSNVADAVAVGTASTGAAPGPQLYVSDAALVRPTTGDANAVFTVRLTGAPNALVPFTYTASAGSLSQADFEVTRVDAQFQPGETTKTVVVPVHGSSTSTGTGTFNLNLSRQSNAGLGDAGGKAYAVSPLSHAFVSVQPATAWRSPYETTTALVPITLDAPAASTVTVTATTVDGTAVAGTDYGTTTTSVTLPAGTVRTLLPVTVLPSRAVTPTRTLSVKLSGATGSAQLSSSTALLTIVSHSAGVTSPPEQAAPSFTAATPPLTAAVGSPYSYRFAATGTPDPTFAVVTGKLPAGLTLNALTGVLSGTPTTTGSSTVTVSARNTVGAAAVTPPLTLTVAPAPVAPAFTAATPPATGDAGLAYDYTFAASGNPAPTFAVAAGVLPPGLGLDATTGRLSGVSGTPGTYSFTVSASNGVGSPAVTALLSVTVRPATAAPVFTQSSPPSNAVVGAGYSYFFAASGNPAPSFLLDSGSLPPGLTLTASGELVGTPTTSGSSTFTVRATNGVGSPAVSAPLTLTVRAAGTGADLEVTISGPGGAVTLGGTATFTLNVRNIGPGVATGVTGSLQLPAGVEFVSAVPSATVVGDRVTWSQSSLSKGVALHWKVTTRPTAKGTLTVSGSATSTSFDPVSTNDAATSAPVTIR